MASESIIRDHLADNLATLEKGMTLIQKNFPLPNIFGTKGYIDILAKDLFNNYVIIELKKSKNTSRETLQEILKYVGLIKHNFKVRDGEIRVIIVSTHWEELIVPFSEFVTESSLSIKGIHISTGNAGTIISAETVTPVVLVSQARQLGRVYHVSFFFDQKKRDRQIKTFIARSEKLGIKDCLIASLYNSNKSPGNHPYLLMYACSLLTVNEYLPILSKSKHFDEVPEEDFDTHQEYVQYLHECLLCELDEGLKADRKNIADGPKFEQMVEDWEYKVESILRHGVFSTDPRLTDEMIIVELKGLHGQSDTRYLNSGDSIQPTRITEIKENCTQPFSFFPSWKDNVNQILDFAQTKRNYRIVVTTYCNRMMIPALQHFIDTENYGYLPGYDIFIDSLTDNTLYVFHGAICWNGKPIDNHALDLFFNGGDEQNLSVMFGQLDEELLKLLNIEMIGFAEIITDTDSKQGIFEINKSDVLLSAIMPKNMFEWIDENPETITMLTNQFQ